MLFNEPTQLYNTTTKWHDHALESVTLYNSNTIGLLQKASCNLFKIFNLIFVTLVILSLSILLVTFC